MSTHPRYALFAFASLGLFSMACASTDDDTASDVFGGSAGSTAGGSGGSAGSVVDPGGSGGSVVDPGGPGGSAGSTGGSAGSTGGSAGSTGGSAGSTGGSAGSTGGSAGSTGGSAGSTGGSAGSTGGSAGAGGTTTALPCNGTPATCADIGADQTSQYYGCCDGDTVYWCDDQTGTWEIHDVDCASQGQACDYDASYDSMWCVGGSGGAAGSGGGSSQGTCNGTPTSCADVGADQTSQYYGCCDGETVYWCDDQTGSWELHEADCASQGQTCEYDSSYDAMWCVADPVDPVDPADPPGPGPGPSCPNLPPIECTGSASYCSELVNFDPDYGDGYVDYPENGETSSNQYRSFIRRDLMMLIKYATAKVACKTAGWTSGNGEPLGLIDMSEANGAIPGTSVGSPGHPAGTHVNGRDIDVAYYQTANMPDNRARSVCEHVQNGQDAYHCVAEPHLLDAWRNAAFLGFLFESPSVRVVGADGKVGPHLDASLDYLCQNGWLTSFACSNRKLAYEVTNQGQGWYYFHHHHMHVSFTPPSYSSSTSVPMSLEPRCLIESCDTEAWNDFLAPFGL